MSGGEAAHPIAAYLAGFEGEARAARDGAGFAAASLPVFTPSAFLAAVRGDLG